MICSRMPFNRLAQGVGNPNFFLNTIESGRIPRTACFGMYFPATLLTRKRRGICRCELNKFMVEKWYPAFHRFGRSPTVPGMTQKAPPLPAMRADNNAHRRYLCFTGWTLLRISISWYVFMLGFLCLQGGPMSSIPDVRKLSQLILTCRIGSPPRSHSGRPV